VQIHPHSEYEHIPHRHSEEGLRRLLTRLIKKMQRDKLVRETMNQLRESLQVDRLILYYFYEQWQGQVTFESLSSQEFSILGSIGEDDCFNDNYAALYLAGRVRAIADIEIEPIETCHRDFLRSMKVRANLVVPILTPTGLWGLLAAHQCQETHFWSPLDIELMQTAAQTLATSPYIIES
jgi:GAF domain-containing protein